jgi:hypothetical protein
VLLWFSHFNFNFFPKEKEESKNYSGKAATELYVGSLSSYTWKEGKRVVIFFPLFAFNVWKYKLNLTLAKH